MINLLVLLPALYSLYMSSMRSVETPLSIQNKLHIVRSVVILNPVSCKQSATTWYLQFVILQDLVDLGFLVTLSPLTEPESLEDLVSISVSSLALMYYVRSVSRNVRIVLYCTSSVTRIICGNCEVSRSPSIQPLNRTICSSKLQLMGLVYLVITKFKPLVRLSSFPRLREFL